MLSFEKPCGENCLVFHSIPHGSLIRWSDNSTDNNNDDHSIHNDNDNNDSNKNYVVTMITAIIKLITVKTAATNFNNDSNNRKACLCSPSEQILAHDKHDGTKLLFQQMRTFLLDFIAI